MIDVERPIHKDSATPEQAVLGCIKKKQAKKVIESKPLSSILPWSLLRFLIRIPALTSLHNRLWQRLRYVSQIKPFILKLLLDMLLIASIKKQPVHQLTITAVSEVMDPRVKPTTTSLRCSMKLISLSNKNSESHIRGRKLKDQKSKTSSH